MIFLTFLESAIDWQDPCRESLGFFSAIQGTEKHGGVTWLGVSLQTAGNASAPESASAQSGCIPNGVRDE